MITGTIMARKKKTALLQKQEPPRGESAAEALLLTPRPLPR